jgi:hypothetical protein
VWSYEPLLPEWDIRASINSAGLLQRMRIAVDKMIKGDQSVRPLLSGMHGTFWDCPPG